MANENLIITGNNGWFEMKIKSTLYDARIKANNVLIELTFDEYHQLVRHIIDKNEYQRKRVRSSKSVYALLKSDLLSQCVIPPIVLALTSNIDANNKSNQVFFDELLRSSDHLVILDGLQRTHTIIELLSELQLGGRNDELQTVLSHSLRVEIYVGLNRIGILYRMLTLNTGQTPMSLRQQIEMLYLDYADVDLNGIELIREADGKVASHDNQYNFKEIIEGFNSYLDRDELPIDKADILENISTLEKLSKENQETDLFKEYVETVHSFICKLRDLSNGAQLSSDYTDSLGSAPFGYNASQVFKKSQAMSGMGAAVAKLFDHGVLAGFEQVNDKIQQLKLEAPTDMLEEINNSLHWLKLNSKKIGNAQRSFFAFYFRELFNPDTEGHLNLVESSRSALRKYRAQNS